MDHPERFEYTLTDKGRYLFQVIAVLMAWGDRWAAPDGAPLVFRHSCGHLGEARVVCSECGEPMEYANVRAKPGPGFSRT
jgi:hypothetical protein